MFHPLSLLPKKNPNLDLWIFWGPQFIFCQILQLFGKKIYNMIYSSRWSHNDLKWLLLVQNLDYLIKVKFSNTDIEVGWFVAKKKTNKETIKVGTWAMDWSNKIKTPFINDVIKLARPSGLRPVHAMSGSDDIGVWDNAASAKSLFSATIPLRLIPTAVFSPTCASLSKILDCLLWKHSQSMPTKATHSELHLFQ